MEQLIGLRWEEQRESKLITEVNVCKGAAGEEKQILMLSRTVG
jgi:hypothetical protein